MAMANWPYGAVNSVISSEHCTVQCTVQCTLLVQCCTLYNNVLKSCYGISEVQVLQDMFSLVIQVTA